MSQKTPLIIDKLVVSLQKALARYGSLVTTLSAGYLLGRVTNELSVANAGFREAFIGIFATGIRPANLLTWIALVALIATPILQRLLKRYHVSRQYDRVLAELLKKDRSPAIAAYGSLALGNCLSLQLCPELYRGWRMSDIRLRHDTTQFSLPTAYRNPYNAYLQENYETHRFFDDRRKLMLTHNPTAFTDSPTLVLETCETTWSHVQFYKENIAVSEAERQAAIRMLMEQNTVTFAHSLCLHMIVETRDLKILITQRSQKGDYYRYDWSCSIEEQATLEDIETRTGVLENWAQRALLEELGLGSDTYDTGNLRIMAVFLESDILNISLCAHVRLDIDSNELDLRLQGVPRQDYEFTRWRFLQRNDLLNEMLHPTRPYHPTSRYRMLMALIRQSDEATVARTLKRVQ